MSNRHAFLLSALLVCFLAPAYAASADAPAETVDLFGVKLKPQIALHGSELRLNGAGVRYKAIFKVYVAGLYLSRKAGTLEEVLAAPGLKRMHITMLRDIDSSELGKLFSRGMEDNLDRASFAKLIPGILRMSQVFSDHKKLKTGDSFALDWIPGKGMLISINDAVIGDPFTEPAFYKAMMAIWLGKSPADWRLKDELLGVKS